MHRPSLKGQPTFWQTSKTINVLGKYTTVSGSNILKHIIQAATISMHTEFMLHHTHVKVNTTHHTCIH